MTACLQPATSLGVQRNSDGVWYLHVLPTHEDNIVLGDVPRPKELRMLNHDVAITWFDYNESIRELTANVSMTMRSDLNNVIAVYWETEPEK